MSIHVHPKKTKEGERKKKNCLANRKAHFYSRPPSQKNSLKHITSKRASDTWKWDRVKEMSDPWVFDNEADYPQRWTRGVRFLLRLPKTLFLLRSRIFVFSNLEFCARARSGIYSSHHRIESNIDVFFSFFSIFVSLFITFNIHRIIIRRLQKRPTV